MVVEFSASEKPQKMFTNAYSKIVENFHNCPILATAVD